MKALKTYQPDKSETTSRRLVNYLIWAAASNPGRAIALPIIAQAVLMLPRKPGIDGQDVKKIRNAVNRARTLMERDHDRTILTVDGIGLRATVGSEDVAVTHLEKKARRHVLATVGLERARSMVRLSEIKDPAVRARVMSISAACKVLSSADVVAKLSLPSKTDDKK